MRLTSGILVLCLLLSSTGASGNEPYAPKAPLLTGLGHHHHPIATSEPWAQRYFDQGLALAWGFNHAEAYRAFEEVTRLDSTCAMGWWGRAYVLGPNINVPMDSASAVQAYADLQTALRFMASAPPAEQALIQALAQRYQAVPQTDRGHLDSAYAAAMAGVHESFPEDPDAGVLYAEALMDLHPWDFWYIDGSPRPWTAPIVELLESELEENPNHPGANHLYIHAVEASDLPDRATVCADRLGGLVPGSGHLVHMPSHIYIRTGRYHEGSLANEAAIRVDDRYLSECRAQGVYDIGYVPHNHHFLWATAVFEGASAKAMAAARSTQSRALPQFMRMCGMEAVQHFSSIPLFSMVRFGEWADILTEPAPDSDLHYPMGVWHYARGMAYARMGKLEPARVELGKLAQFAGDTTLDLKLIWGRNSTRSVLQVGQLVLQGEIQAAEKQYDAAVQSLEDAVSVEDGHMYQEPQDWFFPVRQVLGAVLLEAGEADAAERVYLEDLKKYPENGWSLYGLLQSLKAQGKTSEAALVEKRFQKAWDWADITLPGSRF
jgi:tetratricopeptide (TPR) repeat protein